MKDSKNCYDKEPRTKLFQRASIFAPYCLFHLTGYLKNYFVPFDKPEVLSFCSAGLLLIHQLCPNQKCSKLGFPNRHRGAICPDSAGPAYFSTLHFLLGTSIANHPYLWRKQAISLKLSLYNLESNKKNSSSSLDHITERNSTVLKRSIQDSSPALDSWEVTKVGMGYCLSFRLQKACPFTAYIIHV